MNLQLLLQTASEYESPKPVGFDGNLDGYDKAILGLTDNGQIVYSKEKMVKILMKCDKDMSEEDAWEFLDFNTFNSYIGEQTPIYINTYTY